jgi:UDP-glucose 4-epimerase
MASPSTTSPHPNGPRPTLHAPRSTLSSRRSRTKAGHAPRHHPHVLVTGGAGFIGSHLVERLLAQGKSVVVVDDLSTGSLENLRAVRGHPRLRVIESKISNCAALPELVKQAETVFHLAAAVGVELVVRSPIHVLGTNVRETEVLLEAAAPQGVPVLLASTSEVYGKSQKPAFSEEDDLLIGPPHQARWSYACSKLMDEFLALAYAKEHGLPVVIARLFNTVGPRQTGRYGMVLPRFIAAARCGKPLLVYGDGRQTRCFCYVADTVEALLRLRSCPTAQGQVFNVGSTEEISVLALARLVIKTLGSDSKIRFVPYSRAYAPGFDDMRRRKPVTDKLVAITGFRPATPLRKIIELTAATKKAPSRAP